MKTLVWPAFIGFLCVGIPFIILTLQGKVWRGLRHSEESETEAEKKSEKKGAPADWERVSRITILVLVLSAIGIAVKLAFSEIGSTEIAAGITLKERVFLYWLPLVLLGSALTIWLIKKVVRSSSEPRGESKDKETAFSSLFGVLAACLLLAATYSCFQAGAHHQAARWLLATQGWREPPKEQKLRIIESETVVILEPGQISAPIKVGGSQYVSFHPSTIPNSDVKKLFYFPYNGGHNIVTNRLWDKTTHSIGYEMRLKSERVSGPVRIEVAVGQL